LELRLLRYLIAVVDHGSVSRAAARLAVAQPSLSRQLRALEAELGVTLFDRSQRALRLAPAGEAFLPMARDLVIRADRAVAAMTTLGTSLATPVTLVAPETTVADVIAPFVAAHGSDMPAVNVREALPSEVFDAVVDGVADLGVSSGAVPAARATCSVASFPVWAYVSMEHRWARRRRVRIRELVTEPLVVLSHSHGTRRLFDAAVAVSRACTPPSLPRPTCPRSRRRSRAAGRGVAIVTDDGRYGLHGLRVVTSDGPLRIPLQAGWDPTHYAAARIEGLGACPRRLRHGALRARGLTRTQGPIGSYVRLGDPGRRAGRAAHRSAHLDASL